MLSQFYTDTFSNLGVQISAQLKLAPLQKVRVYETPQLAVFDTVLSLQQFLMHKPQIGLAKKGSSLIEAMTPMWLRNQTPMQIKTDQQTWFEFIESLSKDTNFVIWASENEITGEVIIPRDEIIEIHKRLAEKRIYSIQIQHQTQSLSLDMSQNYGKYSIVIRRPNLFSTHPSYAILAEKVKSPSTMGEFQNLKSLSERINDLSFATEMTSQKQDLEIHWKDLKQLYFNYFATPSERLMDRLVFWLQDMTGFSVKEKLGLNNMQAFAPSELPFWYLQFWSHWWKEAESEKLLRGLLVINAQIVKEDSDFTKKMEQAISEIRSISQWPTE